MTQIHDRSGVTNEHTNGKAKVLNPKGIMMSPVLDATFEKWMKSVQRFLRDFFSRMEVSGICKVV